MADTLERNMIGAPARLEKRADGGRSIVGYAAVFYREDDPGTEFALMPGLVERIEPGAFDRAIRESDDVRALYNHNTDNLLARTKSGTLQLSVDRQGLFYRAEVDESDPDHVRVANKLDRGDLDGSSFAFIPTEERFIDNEGDGPDVRQIEEVRLFDVGPVTFPAYESATSGIRSEDGDMRTEARGKEGVIERYKAWKAERREQRSAETEDATKAEEDAAEQPETAEPEASPEQDSAEPEAEGSESEPQKDEAKARRMKARAVEIEAVDDGSL